jgi:aminoacrylate hydrolase
MALEGFSMSIAKLPDAEIHFESLGEGEPVLLVAGLGGTASYWAPNVPAFMKRHRVVLHDHRGTGKSTRSEMPYSVELMANDLLLLMDSLAIGKAHLVGHSTGGAIGLTLGAIAPERIASLVLYASWAELDAQMEQCLNLRRRILHGMGEAEYHRATPLFLYPPYYTRSHKVALDAEIEATIAVSPSRSIIDARAAGIMTFNGVHYLDRICCPTLVLVAEDDILTPPYSSDLIASRIAGAQLVKVPRGGHALSRTEPSLFNDIVLDFLDRHASGKALP